MNDRQLRYAHAVWQERSFSKASELLRVAQPSLSDQVRLLEQELGFALFVRSNRGVQPTLPGRTFLREVARVVHNLNELKDFAIELNGKPDTQLRIGITPGLAVSLVPAIVGGVGAGARAARLGLLTAGARRLHRLIDQHRLEIGVVLQIADQQPVGNAQMLTHCPLMVIAAADSGLPSPMTLDALAELAVIVHDAAVGFGPVVTAAFRGRTARPRIIAHCDDPAALRAMVAAGLGVALCPAFFVGADEPGLQIVPLDPAIMVELLLLRSRAETVPALERQASNVAAAIRAALGEVIL